MPSIRPSRLLMIASLTAMLVPPGYAGPPLACKWVAVPGSLFEIMEPLRRIAMEADDSPAAKQAARARLRQLRMAAKPGDPLSWLQAGFWTATMHEIGVAPDTDGPELILKALALRPNDPEYHFFAALAFLGTDQVRFRKHWDRTRELAKPGSAAARNLEVVAGLYPEISR